MIIATVTGNVGKNAEVKSTPKGDVCSFDIASTVGKDKVTTWVRCSVWGERGKRLAEYVKKGSRVTAVGELIVVVKDAKAYFDLRVDQLDFSSPKPAQPGTQS